MKPTVILGPTSDLHRGRHRSLIEDPPIPFRVEPCSATHCFLFPMTAMTGNMPSPYEHYHKGEFVDFQQGSELVHAVRWPVLNRRAWILDIDDFGYPFLAGRQALNPDFRADFRRRWRKAFKARILRRALSMLSACSHPSCSHIVLPTRRSLVEMSSSIQELGLAEEAKEFLKKSSVIYPAQRPCRAELVRKKWKFCDKLRVVFCGRDYEIKNGKMAVKIFRRLARRFKGVDFVYIGTTPSDGHEKGQRPFQETQYHQELPRRTVLSVFKRSHILFHPSKSESFGMVFAEAAAAGMAIVAAKGRNMAHLGEILDDQGAVLLDRDIVPASVEQKFFEELLQTLIENPSAAREMGRHNYELARDGRLSVKCRNNQLGGVYKEAICKTGNEPFSLKDLEEGCERITMSCGELLVEQQRYLEEIKFPGSAIII